MSAGYRLVLIDRTDVCHNVSHPYSGEEQMFFSDGASHGKNGDLDEAMGVNLAIQTLVSLGSGQI